MEKVRIQWLSLLHSPVHVGGAALVKRMAVDCRFVGKADAHFFTVPDANNAALSYSCTCA